MSNALSLGVGGLLVGLMLGIVGAGMAGRANPAPEDGKLEAGIESAFIEQMIPHHESAIVMARLALEKGEHAEIKSLAQGIIDAQERENADMRAWYQEWFGGAPASAGQQSPHAHVMNDDAAKLEEADNFDIVFIEQMIPHHQMAVSMAELLGAATEKSEMLSLADQIISSQTREIEMMQSWKSAWVNEGAPVPEEATATPTEE